MQENQDAEEDSDGRHDLGGCSFQMRVRRIDRELDNFTKRLLLQT